MFRLHDRTRRRICLAAFFLLCIVPTVAVLAWCVRIHLPAYATAEAQRLSRALGLNVRLRRVRRLRPGVVRYEGIEMLDPETRQPVLRCPKLTAARQNGPGADGKRRAYMALTAEEPQIEAAAAPQLRRLFDRILRKESARPQLDACLVSQRVILRADEGSRTLNEVRAEICSSDRGDQVNVWFRLDGSETSVPVRLCVGRNRTTAQPTTGFTLDARGGPVPCSLLSLGLDFFGPLSPRSKFLGYLQASRAADGWEGMAAGQLSEVDLGSLVQGRFSHRISGMGEVTLHRATFRRGRLEEASFTVDMGPGQIGLSLLNATAGCMQLVPGLSAERSGGTVPYGQLAAACLINSEGIRLNGRCVGNTPGVILADSHQWLLAEPPVQPQPLVSLLHVLAPANSPQCPVAPQTQWLVRHLPLFP